VTQNKPVFLVTNDDGINAKGIAALVEVVKEFGKVIVISANQSFSGMSHAITVKVPLRIKDLGVKNDVHYYQTNGTPVDCIKLALHFLLDNMPDFIVSGINHGANSSSSVHYSGTMGAAREGCLNGIKSMGFSLLSYSPDADFSESKRVVKSVIAEVIKKSMKPDTYLNVNIPDSKKLDGIKHCRQGKGKWIEEFIEREDQRGQKYYWLTGHFKNLEPEAQDTDEYFLENNYATVVPCTIDVTDFETLNDTNINYAL
jgi:5'-nucleotidase